MECSFSLRHYDEILSKAKKTGFAFSTLKEFHKNKEVRKLLLLRHDIDFLPERALEMARVEKEKRVASTYFVRVHADYNPFNFENYVALREISSLGHEIGLHYENLDVSGVTGEDAGDVLKREKKVLEEIIGRRVVGCAAHRDFTEINNLKFWEDHDLREFGFDYEAYGKEFSKMRYVSDSLGKWSGGKCLCELIGVENVIYANTHPNYWHRLHYHLR